MPWKIYRHACVIGRGRQREAAPRVATFFVYKLRILPSWFRKEMEDEEVSIVEAPFCGCAGENAKSLATISLNTSEFPAYYNITAR